MMIWMTTSLSSLFISKYLGEINYLNDRTDHKTWIKVINV